MSPSVLSDYSLGRKAIPAHHLIALAQVLGVPEDDLIGDLDFGEQEMTPL